MALIARVMALVPIRARLILYRAALLGGGALLVALGTFSGLSRGAARNPFFTDGPNRTLPFFDVLRLGHELPKGLGSLVAIAILGAIAFDLLLTAGALEVLAPDGSANSDATHPGQPVTYTSLMGRGATHLGPFLRLLALVLVLMIAGAGGVHWVFAKIGDEQHRAHATGRTMLYVLPAIQATIATLWLAAVAAFGLVCRAVTVADRRRVVRRTAWLALRACIRHPIRSLVEFVVATVALEVFSGVVLAGARLPISPVSQAAVRAVLTTLVLGAHAVVWLIFVERSRLLWEHSRLGPLRAEPDEAFHFARRFVRLFARRTPPPPSSSPDNDVQIGT